MKTLVTGGTGFIGTALVRALVERGDDVVVLTRGSARKEGDVRYEPWTPEIAGPWTKHVEDADAIIHLAGQGLFDHRWTPEYLALCKQSRVQPTRIIAETIAKQKAAAGDGSKPGPKVFVSASAVGYYGFQRGRDLLTENEPRGNDVLSEIAKAWEDAARPAEAARVRVCHPRLGLVLGKEGGVLKKMLPIFRAFVGGPLGSGEQYFPWVHLADVVDALLFATTTESIRGPFNLVSPNPVTMGEFTTALGAALKRPSFFKVPGFVLRTVLGSQAEALLSGQRAIPEALSKAHFAFLFPTLSSALRDLLG